MININVETTEVIRKVTATGRRSYNISVTSTPRVFNVTRNTTARGPKGNPGDPGLNGDQIVGFRDVAGTTDTLQVSDAGKVVRYSSASDITVTVDASVHAAMDVITLLPEGAGQITVAEGSGFTISWPDADSANCKSPGQNKPIQLLFHSATNATLIGSVS